MTTGILRNPNGAHRTVSDFTTGQDDDGNDLVLSDQSVESFQAGGTILVGQALMLVAPTTTAGPTVVAMTAAVTAADSWRFLGVALEAAVTGDQCRVCTKGIVRVLHDSSTDPAAYDLLIAPGTTTGEFDAVAGAATDDDVIVGYYLSGTDAGSVDMALAMVDTAVVVRFEAGA